jgi:hypothetical protein
MPDLVVAKDEPWAARPHLWIGLVSNRHTFNVRNYAICRQLIYLAHLEHLKKAAEI